MTNQQYTHITSLLRDIAPHQDVATLALQRSKYPMLDAEEWEVLLQQVEGRQRMKDKLPDMVANPLWIFPPRLNQEQSSSQHTAMYKQSLVTQLGVTQLVDLTGGYGIDFLYMSKAVREAHYVERNEELCHLLQYNLSTLPDDGCTRHIHSCHSENFLPTLSPNNGSTLLYLDPARRSQSGNKVFRLEDCEPNVLELLPTLRARAQWIMLKLSPMLDPTAAIRSLGGQWQTHIVAMDGEVKEVLLLQSTGPTSVDNILAVDVHRDLMFTFTHEEENNAEVSFCEHIQNGDYLYEPHSALLKAGAYRLLSQRYDLHKLGPNTHLYTHSEYRPEFPGRIFRIEKAGCASGEIKGTKANVICRNYGKSADELRKQLRIRDGGDLYVIGAGVCEKGGSVSKPTLYLAHREK